MELNSNRVYVRAKDEVVAKYVGHGKPEIVSDSSAPSFARQLALHSNVMFIWFIYIVNLRKIKKYSIAACITCCTIAAHEKYKSICIQLVRKITKN